jgi:hypothetical protein
MITITIHLNWKFRNQWDTVGFVPWYMTKLLAAPVIALAAAGFLSQVRLAQDAPGDVSNLALVAASALLLFAIAIVTALFSNRMFDWLKDPVTRVRRAASPPAPEEPGGGAATGSAAENAPAEAQ